MSMCFIFTLLGADTCEQYTLYEDVIDFTKQVLRLNSAVLGVRWMTWKYRHPGLGIYNKENTDRMYAKLQEAGVDKRIGLPINFLIRGHYANRSRENLMDLYQKFNKTNPVTFTFYSDEQYYRGKRNVTPLSIPEMRDAIQFLGPENVYLQVSDEVRADLELRSLSNPRPRPRSTIISAASFVHLNFIPMIIAFTAVKFVELIVFY